MADADGPKLKVLISHADADQGLVGELVEGLNFDGRFEVKASPQPATFDEGEFGARAGAIAAADTIIFVVSPASANGKVLSAEASQASAMSKRMFTVIARDVAGSLPGGLDRIEPVRFDGDHSFMEGLKNLVAALEPDVAWLRVHTQLLTRALQWENSGRPPEKLLTGDELVAAKRWRANQPPTAPGPSDIHLAYIDVSENPDSAAEAASQPLLEMAEAAPAENPEVQALKKANRFYIFMSLGLAAVAGIAAWQAWQAKQEAVGTAQRFAQERDEAERSKVSMAIQQERIEEAISTVAASLCTEMKAVTSTLVTTRDPAVWDSTFNVFWSLYNGPMIALEKLHSTSDKFGNSEVGESMKAFADVLGTRGEPYEARVSGLPRLDLQQKAVTINAACAPKVDEQQ